MHPSHRSSRPQTALQRPATFTPVSSANMQKQSSPVAVAPSPLTRPKTAVPGRLNGQAATTAPTTPASTWAQATTQVERAAQRPPSSLSAGRSSPHSSPQQSRPTSAGRSVIGGWSGGSAAATSTSNGGGSTSRSMLPFNVAPPSSSSSNALSPFTPNVPFNSFTPFTGPYAYLAQHTPTQTSTNAHIDWLRIEVLRRDIKLLSQAIRAGIDSVNQQQQQQQSSSTNPVHRLEKIPSFAPLPLPLLTQLGGAAFLHTLSTRSLKIVGEEKSSGGSSGGVDGSVPPTLTPAQQEQIVPTAEWQALVERALQRFGHSSDYLQALSSTVGLLEVWGVQVSRITETANWMTDRTLSQSSAWENFQTHHRAQNSITPTTVTTSPVFSFTTVLSPSPPNSFTIPLAIESDVDGSRTLGNSSSTSSLGLSSPSNLTESSLFHALPSLASLLDKLHLLTTFVGYSEIQSLKQSRQIERLKKDTKKMQVEMEILATAVKEAAEDRPKQKRIVHEHVHLTRPSSAAYQQQQQPQPSYDVTDALPLSNLVVDIGSPSSTLRSTIASSPVSTTDRRPLNIRPGSPLKVREDRSRTSDESLQHEIWLLRQSLQEERQAKREAKEVAAKEVSEELNEARRLMEEAHAAAEASEARALAAETALAHRTSAFDLSTKRLQLELTEIRLTSESRLKESFTVSEEERWKVRLQAERLHRDEVEKHRWTQHLITLEQVRSELAKMTSLYTQLQSDYDLLKQQSLKDLQDSEKRHLELFEQHSQAEKERVEMLASSKREAASLKQFEADLLKKKAQLEKELAKLAKDETTSNNATPAAGAGSAANGANAASLKSLQDELNRLRREKSQLEKLLEEGLSRSEISSKQWLEQLSSMKELKEDLKKRCHENDELKRLITSLQTELKQLSEDSNMKYSKLKSEFDEENREKLTTLSEYKDLQARYTSLQDEFQQLKHLHHTLESEQVVSKSENITLSSHIQSLEEELKKTLERCTRLEGVQREYDANLIELERLNTIIRGLEARLSSTTAGADLTSTIPTPLTSPSRSPSASRLLHSPSAASMRVRSPSASQLASSAASSSDREKRELEQGQLALKKSRDALALEDADAAKRRAILEQQRLDLIEEQKLLQSASEILHGDLLTKLLLLLPLNFVNVSRLNEKDPSIHLADVDDLRTSLRHHTELTDAIHTNLTNELQQPSTELHPPENSLSARLEALRRACEFHEQRLNGLSPSPTTNITTSNKTNTAAAALNRIGTPAPAPAPAASPLNLASHLTPHTSVAKRVVFD